MWFLIGFTGFCIAVLYFAWWLVSGINKDGQIDD